jgi:nucleotide-binding universal stress UspA family protein
MVSRLAPRLPFRRVMYGKIVVGVDETDAAARAVREALALASEGRAQVHFVHAGVDPAGERALGWAAQLAARCGVTASIARVEAAGGAGPAVVREAERWGADLIVVGRHDRGGLERLLLGSVAEAVARAAEVPVLLVRRGTLASAPG